MNNSSTNSSVYDLAKTWVYKRGLRARQADVFEIIANYSHVLCEDGYFKNFTGMIISAPVISSFVLFCPKHATYRRRMCKCCVTYLLLLFLFPRYDHLRKEAQDIKPGSREKATESWRSALETEITSYVRDQYNQLGSTSVYGPARPDGSVTLIVCIESHQYNPKNFW